MVWNLANAPGAKADIETVLRDNAGVDLQISNAHMIGATRQACAEVDLSGEKCASIVQRLGLKEFTVADTPVLFHADGCPLYDKFKNGDPIKAYKIDGRPDSLRLKSGSAFESLYLFYQSETNKCCIVVDYAYG